MAERRTRSTALVQASDDRTIPAKYAGTIEPNYYCRGWNSKRQKYCRARAGFRTVHVGKGRCWRHGGQREGDKRLKHGRFATVQTQEIRQLMEQLAENADPLNMIEDLLLARAYLRKLVNADAESGKVDTVMAAVDTLSKVTHRIEMARAAYALSRPEFLRIMTEMGRQVEAHVTELGRQLRDHPELDAGAEAAATLKRIRDGWISIRL